MAFNNISKDLLKNNKPMHKTIDFVNTPISKDIKLFIDPVLIEIGDSKFCEKAKMKTTDFFKQLHNAYYVTNDESKKKFLLTHASEINDTHLGYARKYGKGNTEEGLYDIFKGIDDYVSSIKIQKLFELVLYVPGFAEDGMSDLLTNVLYKELSEFTLQQCKKYNVKTTKCPVKRFFWNDETHTWEEYTGDSLVINGKVHLLVPKEIVQNRYRFTTDNFLRSVIVENICIEKTTYDENGKEHRPRKGETREKLLKQNGTIFQTIHKFAEKDPNLLLQYQKIVNDKYQSLCMTDDELDASVYKDN